MKKVIGMCLSRCQEPKRDPVHFTDANLKAAVVAELNKTHPTITEPTEYEMLLLIELYASGSKFTDLTGIGYATNLTELILDGNQLTSLPSEIGDLMNLTSLILNKYKLTNLPEAIGNLKNLKELDLRDNQLTEDNKKRVKSLLPKCNVQF
jgi:Leucine-rich repeat (LRR) protein